MLCMEIIFGMEGKEDLKVEYTIVLKKINNIKNDFTRFTFTLSKIDECKENRFLGKGSDIIILVCIGQSFCFRL